jgi:putative peptidoglycan lipid II flippase
MKSAFIYIFVFSIFAKLVGFVRELLISNYYGVSDVTDAFNIAQSIPGFFLTFLGIAVSTTFIPIYNRITTYGKKKEADEFFSSLIVLFTIFGAIVTLLIIYQVDFVVYLFAPGLEGDAKLWANELTEICSLSVILFCITFLFNSYLNGTGNFLYSSITTVPYNLVLLFSVFWSLDNGVEYLAIGKVIASLVQVILLILLTIKSGWIFSFGERLNTKEIKNVALLSIPAIMGSGVEQINRLVDKNIASTIMSGGISIINYSERVLLLVEGVLIAPIIMVLFTKLSQSISKDGLNQSVSFIQKGISILIVVSLPFSVYMFLFSHSIVDLVYGRGEFTDQDIIITSSLLSVYSLSIFFNSIRQIVSRVFYCIEDTKTPMVNAVVGVCINIILNIILSAYLGLIGLALASLISSIMVCGLLFRDFSKIIVGFNFNSIYLLLLKVFSSTFICVLFFYFFIFAIENIWGPSGFSFVIGSLLSLIVYVLFLIILKVEEVQYIFYTFKERVL